MLWLSEIADDNLHRWKHHSYLCGYSAVVLDHGRLHMNLQSVQEGLGFQHDKSYILYEFGDLGDLQLANHDNWHNSKD